MSRVFHIKSKYLNDTGTLKKGTYRNGSLAVLFVSTDPDSFSSTSLSVNLEDYGVIPVADCFFVKNYSECVGLADAVEVAGIATKINVFEFGPFDASATLMRLV